MSSTNSLRFVDVKARPDRSNATKPDAAAARFPDPLASQREVSEPSAAPDASAAAAPDSTEPTAQAKREATAQSEHKPSKRSETTDPDEFAGDPGMKKTGQDDAPATEVTRGPVLTESIAAQEAPSDVAIGGDANGIVGEAAAQQGDKPVQTSQVNAAPALPVEEQVPTPLPETTVEAGTQVAAQVLTSNAAPESLATHTTTTKVDTTKKAESSESEKASSTTAQQAPALANPLGDANASGEFGDGQSEPAPLDPLMKAEATEKPSIETAIKDARIESIAMDSRPSTPTASVQATPTVAQTGLGSQATPAATSEAILTQIHARIQPGMNRAILRLSPESLGRISIAVSVDAGEVRAEMRVESADSMQAIQKYIPELKAMFAQADMELSELNLQLDSGGAGFGWEEESPTSQQSWVGRSAAQKSPSVASIEASPTRLTPLEGGLDLIA